jgi:hypothetical protein
VSTEGNRGVNETRALRLIWSAPLDDLDVADGSFVVTVLSPTDGFQKRLNRPSPTYPPWAQPGGQAKTALLVCQISSLETPLEILRTLGFGAATVGAGVGTTALTAACVPTAGLHWGACFAFAGGAGTGTLGLGYLTYEWGATYSRTIGND